jgi:hypothetical protein
MRASRYDAELSARETDGVHPVQDEVDIDEMDIDDDGNYIWSCRCGGEYVASTEELEQGSEFYLCTSCTLCIRVLFEAAGTDDDFEDHVDGCVDRNVTANEVVLKASEEDAGEDPGEESDGDSAHDSTIIGAIGDHNEACGTTLDPAPTETIDEGGGGGGDGGEVAE